MGPDLPILNYRISSSGRYGREIACMQPQEGEISVEIARSKSARDDRAQILAYGKLQLLLLGSRLHFPSENRKSCTSLHSGSIDSVQNSEAKLQNFEALSKG